MKALIGFFAGLILLVLGALFAGANDGIVTMDYLLGSFHWPLSYILLLSFFSGALVTLFSLLPSYLRWQHEKVRLKRKLSQQQKELDNLRVLPVQDSL